MLVNPDSNDNRKVGNKVKRIDYGGSDGLESTGEPVALGLGLKDHKDNTDNSFREFRRLCSDISGAPGEYREPCLHENHCHREVFFLLLSSSFTLIWQWCRVPGQVGIGEQVAVWWFQQGEV